MQIGLMGAPFGGKTTFFNLLTGAAYATGPDSSMGAHTGSARVPDPRIDFLAGLFKPRKTTYTQIQFKDIPGLRTGNSNTGAAAKLLEEARSCDALVQVVRAFQADFVNAAAGEPSPLKELQDFQAELLFADMGLVETRIKHIKEAKKPAKNAACQLALFEGILSALEAEKSPGSLCVGPEQQALLAEYNFLTEKPLFAALNIDEYQQANGGYPGRERVISFAADHGITWLEICAQIEMEINLLPPEERADFLRDLQLAESGLARLARAVYERLGLISFFTVGDDEVKAWTVRQGAAAKKAAGKIHSDIERGFIRAEVVHYDDLYRLGSISAVREKGLFRLEGKEYLVQDGDVVNFRFNV